MPSSFIAFLVGFIDGDGYIQVTQTGKGFIAIKLVITLHLKDLSTLEYIHSVLRIGKINKYPDLINPRCRLVINRTDLQSILFPLLLHHQIFFLTYARTEQFNLVMYILHNNIKRFHDIPNIKKITPTFIQPNTAEEYSKLFFFRN